jgi:hypothetical protein
MRKTIVLTFTAAALLFAAGLALDSYGREIFEGQRAAEVAAGLRQYWIPECYGDCEPLESWEKAAGVAWLLALSLLIAGIKLSADPPPPYRVSMLGLHAGPSRRRAVRAVLPAKSAVVVNVRARATRPASLHGDDGLTPLERVIRSS